MNDPLPKPRSRRDGLSLVECLLASVVLAVAATATLTAIGSSYQQRVFADERQAALRLAGTLMEQAISRPYDAAPPPTGTPATGGGGLLGGLVGGVGKTLDAVTGSSIELTLVDRLASGLSALDGQSDRVTADGEPAGADGDAYTRFVRVGPARDANPEMPASVGQIEVDVETPGGQHVRLRRLVLPE